MEYPFKDLQPLDETTARTGYYKDWTHIDVDTFHQISELVKFIREKGYGADTREAIAQALERVYHDAAKSGNANMEVSMARKHFKDLASRLDASDDDLRNIDVNWINKNLGKLDQSFMSEEFLQQMAGNTPINAVPADDSVTKPKIVNKAVAKHKTDFISPSFTNFATIATVESGFLYHFETGAKNPDSRIDSYKVSLEVGETYITRYTYSDDVPENSSYVTFYDSANNHIGGVNASVFTVPTGTALTIVARMRSLDNPLIIAKQSEALNYNLEDGLSADLSAARGTLNRVGAGWYDPSSELHLEYDPKTRIDGYYYDLTGQKVTSVAGSWGTTPKLYLEKNTVYVKKWFSSVGIDNNAHVSFWLEDGTEEGTWLSTISAGAEFKTPNDYDFVRIAVHALNNAKAQLYQKDNPHKVLDRRLALAPENIGKELSPLYGKVINVLGDSISSTDYTRPNWWEQISEETGAIFNDFGWSATTLAHDPADGRHLRGPHFTDLPAGTEIGGCMVERYVNLPDADATVVMGGTNDGSAQRGSWDSVDDSTLFGALNLLITGLLNKFPGKPLIFMTIIQASPDYTTNVADAKSALLAKAPTDTLSRQLRAEAIKLKCAQYGVTCIDLYNTSGISGADDNKVYYRPNDTLHPSALGQNAIRTMLKPVLEDKFS